VERIRNVLPITDKKCPTGKCKKFGCENVLWFNIFRDFGRYAHGKIIPDWVQKAPKCLINEFINGYMRSDGNTKKNGTRKITTVSHNLAYGLQRLYLKLGYISSIEGRTVNQRDTYEVSCQSQKCQYCSFIEDNYVWCPLFKKQKSTVIGQPVYNFEVENDNSYIVENVIVHNCQGFSHAGKKKENDPRNELVYEFVRAVKCVRPEWIIGENVSGLLARKGVHPQTGKKIPVIEIINSIFNDIGYSLTWTVVAAGDFGVPQNRKRLIIIGHDNLKTRMNNIYPHMNWENCMTHIVTTLRPILENTLDGAMEFPPKNIPPETKRDFWIKTDLTEPPVNNIVHPNLIRLVNGIRNKSTSELKDSNKNDKTVVNSNGLISFGRRISGYHGEIDDPDQPSAA